MFNFKIEKKYGSSSLSVVCFNYIFIKSNYNINNII